jgi:TRAP-type C4-dicarboxylate transport system permease small subunit
MSTPAAGNGGRKHAAGAYDVRFFIAGLIGFYGVVLVLMGLFADTAADKAKTGGVNANLWAGLVMVVVAIAFAVWARLRPVLVDEQALAEAHAAMDQQNAPGH